MTNFCKKVETILPYLVAILICIIISIPVTSDSIVLDEGYSITLVRGSVIDILKGAAADEHPPLFHLILKIPEAIWGENLLIYRLVTVLGTALNLLWLGATKIRKRWGNGVSLFYVMLFGFSYSTMERSTVVRMYSWGCLFVTAAVLYLYFYYEERRKKDFVITVVCTIASLYTHYYAAMTMVVAWGIAFFYILIRERKRLKEILLAGFLIVLGFLPWLAAFTAQLTRVADDFWISEFDWAEWRNAPALLIDCDFPGFGTVMYALFLFILVIAALRRNWTSLYLAAVMFGTMLLGAAISVWVTPIWQPRYPYNAWGLLMLAVALVVGQRVTRTDVIPQTCMFLLLCVMGYYSTSTIVHSQVVNNTATQWRAYLDENIGAGDVVIADDPGEHRFIYMFYIPQTEVTMVRKLEHNGGSVNLEELIGSHPEGKIWYICDHVQVRYGVEKMTADFDEIGYEMKHQANFTIQDKDLDIYLVEERQNEK